MRYRNFQEAASQLLLDRSTALLFAAGDKRLGSGSGSGSARLQRFLCSYLHMPSSKPRGIPITARARDHEISLLSCMLEKELR